MPRLLLLLFENDPKPLVEPLRDRISSWVRQARARGFDVARVNLAFPYPARATSAFKADVVVLDTTLLRRRWNESELLDTLTRLNGLDLSNAFVVAAPHDEFTSTIHLKAILDATSCQLVLSCLGSEDAHIVYGDVPYAFETVLAAHLSPRLLRIARGRHLPLARRDIDIFYRVGTGSRVLGPIGELKTRVGHVFAEIGRRCGLRVDIEVGRQHVLSSRGWMERLSRSRSVLGVESGSQLTNPDGNLAHALESVGVEEHESGTAQAPGDEDATLYRPIQALTLSARHLEAAVTKTPQFLVEGHYQGLFHPYEHYVPISPDLANADHAVSLLENAEGRDKLECMAETLFKHVTNTPAFSEAAFTDPVLGRYEGCIGVGASSFPGMVLRVNFRLQSARLAFRRLRSSIKARWFYRLPM